MKKMCLLLMVFLFWLVQAEGQSFFLNDFSFFLSPTILEDGTIIDTGLEYSYTNTLGTKLNFRYTQISKNEELLNVEDSLNAVNETFYEIFFSPIEYYFYKAASRKVWLGAGLYYEYNQLREKGYFNMPSLETLDPPKERVNSYTNDFSMHLFGPLVDTGINFSFDWLSVGFSGGIVPFFYLTTKQTTNIVPLLYPHMAKYSQDTFGSPHFYVKLDSIILKYVNFVLLYDFARLQYDVINFDDNLAWITTKSTIVTHSLKIETSALIPLGIGTRFQIGFGYAFESMYHDSYDTVLAKPYLILSAKKL